MYLTAESLFIQGKIDSIKTCHTSKQHSASWKIINEICGHKDHPSIQLRKEKRREDWFDHFHGLLGNPPKVNEVPLPMTQVFDNLDISTNPFTASELKKALKLFLNNKSSGLDEIPTVLWTDPTFLELLLEFFNHSFEYYKPPSAWLTRGIIPVPKKGDLTSASNYRGITLIPIAAENYNKMILNRKDQNGFRKGRSTLSLKYFQSAEFSKKCGNLTKKSLSAL